jgi:hypothetical protein
MLHRFVFRNALLRDLAPAAVAASRYNGRPVDGSNQHTIHQPTVSKAALGEFRLL